MAGSEGADWMLGNVGKKPARKIAHNGIHVTPDEIDAVLNETRAAAKKLAHDIKSATAGVQALRESGLTGEALVVLVTEKCGNYRTDGGRYQKPTQAVVQCVLEALLRIGEYAP